MRGRDADLLAPMPFISGIAQVRQLVRIRLGDACAQLVSRQRCRRSSASIVANGSGSGNSPSAASSAVMLAVLVRVELAQQPLRRDLRRR